MSRRISKRVREEAALICAISASWPDRDHWYFNIGPALEASAEAIDLACEALIAATTRELSRAEKKLRLWSRDEDAEAEALLRTGWSP